MGQDGQGVLVDDSSQVGVDQDGVWRLHVNLTLGPFDMPCSRAVRGSKVTTEEESTHHQHSRDTPTVVCTTLPS